MKVILFANSDWYLFNFRRSLALSIQDSGHKIVLLSPNGPYGAKLIELGLDWRPVPMQRSSLNPFREIGVLYWLWTCFRTEKPDIIHGFTIKCAVYAALIGKILGIAHVSAVAGLGYIFTSNDTKAVILKPLVTRIMKFALSGARSQTILQNPDDVKLFLDNKIVALEKISLILGSGVDLTRFTEKQIDNASLFSPMRVLLAARLLREKGILEFVEASKILKTEGRNIDFLLAGEPDPGNPASIEESTVVGWDQEGAVKWLRHVEDMPALLKGCDIFVLPTYYGEGVPKSLIEAAACSLALVTTDMPGCREVVTHEVDGLLVPVKNARGLADAIARFLDDRQFSNAMGQAARLKAIQLFDERIVIAKTLDVYQKLL